MTSTTSKKVRVPDLALMKQRGDRIVMLTAYDATMARLLDRAGIDLLLVGDSLGNVIMGLDTTIPVTLDVMIHHTRAVARGANRALVVADMPFLTYQVSPEQATRNATRLFQEGGAAAVKLEGGRAIADTVRKLTAAGLPVMGHLGLTPQHVHRLGGMRQQARSESAAHELILDALALEDAGAFAIVLKAIPRHRCRGRNFTTEDSDHRDRRRIALRWPGAGQLRRSRTLRHFRTALRQTVRAARSGDRACCKGLRERRARGSIPKINTQTNQRSCRFPCDPQPE